jgi:hypothetical protein
MNVVKIVFLSMVAGACCLTNGLTAWQRSAMSDCKEDAKECTKSPDRCQRENEKCKHNANDKDLSSFSSELSTYSSMLFSRFTMDQKKQAMDNADKNKMSPDDAVGKVAGACGC